MAANKSSATIPKMTDVFTNDSDADRGGSESLKMDGKVRQGERKLRKG